MVLEVRKVGGDRWARAQVARPGGALLCASPCKVLGLEKLKSQTQPVIAMGWAEDTAGGTERPGDRHAPPSPVSLNTSCFLGGPRSLHPLEGPSCLSLRTPALPSILDSSVLAARKPTSIHRASVPSLGSLGGFADETASLL